MYYLPNFYVNIELFPKSIDGKRNGMMNYCVVDVKDVKGFIFSRSIERGSMRIKINNML